MGISKKILMTILSIVILLAVSCRNEGTTGAGGEGGSAGGAGDTGGIGVGSGGGDAVGNNYVLPVGSLSQEEQKKPYDPNVNTTTLFKLGDYNSKFFRIPALIVTKKGTILAGTERRYENTANLGKGKTKIDVIIRRSEDLGKTWSDAIEVKKATKTDYSDSYGNPSLVNCHNGDVLMAVITEPGTQKDNKGETVIYRSKDDGKTWNEQTRFKNTDISIQNAKKGVVASGQGLTLRHGQNANAKRLMFAYFQWNNSGGGLSVSAIRSDDDGNTFKAVGNIKPTNPDNNIDETKAIELSDGSIMFNHRRGVSGSAAGGMSWSKSTDGGVTWTSQGKDPEVDDPGNNAGFARYEFNGKHIKDPKYILMIHANAKPDGKWFDTRKNHHIKMTKNDFGNGVGTATGKYAYNKQLVNGGANLYSGYPDITVLPDGTIATLTEETRVNKTDEYDIVFRRFNLYWLTDGKEWVDYSKDYLFKQYQN